MSSNVAVKQRVERAGIRADAAKCADTDMGHATI